MAYFAPIKAKDVWEYIARTLTSAENITSDGNPIDQSKIAKLDATISSRMSNQYESKLPKLDYLDVAVSTRSSHSPADVWSYSNRGLTTISFAEGDVVIADLPTERTVEGTTKVKVKEAKIHMGGTLRIEFELKSSSSGSSANAHIYVNEERVKTISTTSTTYVQKSTTIDIDAGDTVSIYLNHATASNTAYIRNVVYKAGSLIPRTTNLLD